MGSQLVEHVSQEVERLGDSRGQVEPARVQKSCEGRARPREYEDGGCEGGSLGGLGSKREGEVLEAQRPSTTRSAEGGLSKGKLSASLLQEESTGGTFRPNEAGCVGSRV